MLKSSTDKLKYICSLSYNIHKLPIYLFDKQGNLIFEAPLIGASLSIHPFLSKEDILRKVFLEKHSSLCPVFQEINYLESFLTINIFSDNIFNGKIIIGPILLKKLTNNSLKNFIADCGIQFLEESLISYYKSLPFLKKIDATYIGKAIYYMIYQQEVNTSELSLRNLLLDENFIGNENLTLYTYKQRQKEIEHNTDYENRIFECIKRGRTEELINCLKSNSLKFGVLSKTNYIRSEKNIMISGITLAARSAVSGGLKKEIAYPLSDLYIQKLERLDNSEDISQLIYNAFIDFTERVNKNNKFQYSKPINLCIDYINVHFYEDIRLNKLGQLIGLNQNYLSNLFKKEVGITITDYIHNIKVEEAKYLLTYTNLEICEISNSLNFHDQSHFSKIFKKKTKVTPNHYRNSAHYI